MVRFNFNQFKPIRCRDAERALKNLGFEEGAKKATSHRKFQKIVNGHLYSVTLDCHKGEVSALNLRSIIKQAGVSREEFYKAID